MSRRREPCVPPFHELPIGPHHRVRLIDAEKRSWFFVDKLPIFFHHRATDEIELPATGTDWKRAMRERAVSARSVLRRHPWAVGLLDSRSTPGPATLRHHDAVLGALRAGGFSVPMAAHAFSLIDSYLYGFVLQESSLPFSDRAELDQVAGGILDDQPADAYPHLTELITDYALRPDYSYADEFEFGLALILDALRPDVRPSRRRTSPSRSEA